MSTRRSRISLLSACYGVAGICLFVVPWALLLLSDKSPLRSHNAAYINGFAMGIGFIFFMLVGIWLVVGAIAAHRRHSSRREPAQ
jgi:hypothetical protein